MYIIKVVITSVYMLVLHRQLKPKDKKKGKVRQMNLFLKGVASKTTDIRGFLKEAAAGNSLKYRPEKGHKHQIYIPYTECVEVDENGNETIKKGIVSISGKLHEWTGNDGKYKATICTQGKVLRDANENIICDGSCAFCDSTAKAWEIYNYRMEQERLTCGKSGEDLQKHLNAMKKTFADERKAKEAREVVYMLVAVFRMKPDGTPVMSSDGTPEYDIKVAKQSSGSLEKMLNTIENSGASFEGCEIIREYPNLDDPRLVVSQSVMSVVYPDARLTVKYPGVIAKINEDVAKFDWDGLEKSFPEWTGMTTEAANKAVGELFKKWDEFQERLLVDPNARYMEYLGSAATNVPVGGTNEMPKLDGKVIQTITPQVPGVAPQTAPTTQKASIPDANAIFGGSNNKITLD